MGLEAGQVRRKRVRIVAESQELHLSKECRNVVGRFPSPRLRIEMHETPVSFNQRGYSACLSLDSVCQTGPARLQFREWNASFGRTAGKAIAQRLVEEVLRPSCSLAGIREIRGCLFVHREQLAQGMYKPICVNIHRRLLTPSRSPCQTYPQPTAIRRPPAVNRRPHSSAFAGY